MSKCDLETPNLQDVQATCEQVCSKQPSWSGSGWTTFRDGLILSHIYTISIICSKKLMIVVAIVISMCA